MGFGVLRGIFTCDIRRIEWRSRDLGLSGVGTWDMSELCENL